MLARAAARSEHLEYQNWHLEYHGRRLVALKMCPKVGKKNRANEICTSDTTIYTLMTTAKNLPKGLFGPPSSLRRITFGVSGGKTSHG
jgi:hypothetical protein